MDTIKKNKLIRNTVNFVRFIQNYYYDFKRFTIHSGTYDESKNKEISESRLIFQYHQIEKGLSLKNPRIGFGVDKINVLIDSIQKYVEKYGVDDTIEISINVLNAYKKFHESKGYNDTELFNKIDKLKSNYKAKYVNSGIKSVSKKDIETHINEMNYEEFFNARFSIRQFSDLEVEIELIKKSINIARKTPSVCNRQGWKAHVYNNKTDIEQILQYQNGNRGFTDSINKLIITTADLSSSFGIGERNQGYVDGGMFSMSLVNALHSKGLGTCCLNCSINSKVDKKLRKVAKIPESESIIMMIAVGHLPEKLNVASSVRKNLDKILMIH